MNLATATAPPPPDASSSTPGSPKHRNWRPHRSFSHWNFSFFAGAAAATIASLALSPLDQMKILITRHSAKHPYKGFFKFGRIMARENGLSIFWKGAFRVSSRYAFLNGVRFCLVEQTMPFVARTLPIGSVFQTNPCAPAAFLSAAAVMMFTLLLPAAYQWASGLKGFAGTASQRGLLTLLDYLCFPRAFVSQSQMPLNTLGISMVRAGVYWFCFFGFFSYLREGQVERGGEEERESRIESEEVMRERFSIRSSVRRFSGDLVWASVAAYAASLISFPFDTIRRRLMMSSFSRSYGSSIFSVSSAILKNEGVYSFFRGATGGFRSARPAVMMATYQLLKDQTYGGED